MAKNLFVGNLPFTTTDDILSQLFAQAGQTVSVNIIKDKYSGRSRGFGFVEMSTEEEAAKAIEMFNNYSLEGRNIVVREALPRTERPAGAGGGFGGGRGGGNRGGGHYRGGDRDQQYHS